MVEHGELLQRLTLTPGAARALTPRSPEQGWPPQVVVGHLAYVETNVWLPRLLEMAATDVPVWSRWEPDGVDWSGLYGARNYSEVVEEFEQARSETVDYLRRLPGPGWDRRAQHATFGDLAVAGLCERIIGHDREHLAQLGGS